MKLVLKAECISTGRLPFLSISKDLAAEQKMCRNQESCESKMKNLPNKRNHLLGEGSLVQICQREKECLRANEKHQNVITERKLFLIQPFNCEPTLVTG